MTQQIHCFGGDFRSQFWMSGHADVSLTFDRVIMFDRDIDGHWLVWATAPLAARSAAEQENPDDLGSLIVRDPVVLAFIETLVDLVAHPGQFGHEPTFTRPEGVS